MEFRKDLYYEKAKEILKQRGILSYEKFADNIEKLIEELNIYEIELEYQLKELEDTYRKISQINEEYQHIFNNAPVGYVVVDSLGVITKVNDFFCKKFNTDKKTFLDKKITNFIAPNYQDSFYFYFNRVKNQETLPEPFEINMKVNDISNYFLIRGSYQNSQNLVYFSLIDISEQYHIKQQLLEKELLWQTAFDAIEMGICVVDANNGILAFNNFMKEIFLREIHYIPDKFFKLFHSEEEKVLCPVCLAISEGHKSIKEFYLEKENHFYEVAVTPIFIEKKFSFKSIVTVKDMSIRRFLEKSLRESEEKYRSIFENKHTPMLLLDPVDGRIVSVNVAAAFFYKYAREFLEENTYQLISTEENEKLKFYFFNLINNNKDVFVEKHKLADGTIVDVELHLSPIVIKNKQYLLAIVIDITQKLKMENDLKFKNKQLYEALKKAQESEKLKSTFIANISHEIRTPMNGIIGFADLLEDETDPDKRRYFLSIIKQSSNRLLEIVNSLIEISKIEANVVELRITNVNVTEELKFLYDFFLPKATQKNLQLICPCLSKSDFYIRTDREKLYSILSNLIKNALKFTEKGSVEFGFEVENEQIKFYVKDTGVGIPENMLDKIFDRFMQLNMYDDKILSQGVGLGLSIAKSYAEMLDGKIFVESKVGEGSKFYLYLPLELHNEKKPNKEMELLFNNNFEGIKPLKILIVEDDTTSLNYLKIVVEPFAREMLEAKSGQEAIDICRENADIDLILMDMRMPNIDGYTATREIRKFNQNVIIIAQTAYGFLTDRQKALESGANEYLAKPIYRRELIDVIKKFF